MYQNHIITVIIPVLNEEQSIAKVIAEIPEYIDKLIVVDNGSTDNSIEIAKAHGAITVSESLRGYGAACLRGLQEVQENNDIIVFIDGDYSDYPIEMTLLLDQIIYHNYEVVIGSRMLSNNSKMVLAPAARFGNWLSTRLIALLWNQTYTDLGPFRAIRWDSFQKLDMQDKNFGWTVELQIKAAKLKLRSTEVPVSYRERIGTSKISGTIIGSIKAGCKILYLIFKGIFT